MPDVSFAFRSRMGVFFERLSFALVLGLAFLVPLLFQTNGMALDIVKQTAFLVLVGALVIAGSIRAILEKKFLFVRGGLIGVLLLCWIGIAFSKFFSIDPYASWVGRGSEMGWTDVSLFGFVLFGIFAGATLRHKQQFETAILVWIASSTVIALTTLGSLLHVPFLRDIALVGSVFDVPFFLLPALILALERLVHPLSIWKRIWLAIFVFVSLVIFGLINMLVAWILLFAGIVLLLVVEYAIRRNSTFRSLLWAWIPGLVALVSLIFFLPFVGSRIASMNPWLALQRATQVSAPGEVALNATTSWHLAKTLVKEHPAFGTGVGTWVYGYARLRDAALNLSPFWDASFDQGSSTFFTLLGTIGIVGILALFLALVWMIIASVRACAHARKEQGHEKEGVFIAGLLLIAALFFVNLPFTSIFGVWFLLVICLGTGRHRVFHWGEKEEAGHYAGYYTRPVLLGFAILVGFLLIWGAGQRALAESQLVKAQQLGNAGAVSQAVESAMRSHAWNPLDDTSLRMLSKLFLFPTSLG